jgi:hypothetical protein
MWTNRWTKSTYVNICQVLAGFGGIQTESAFAHSFFRERTRDSVHNAVIPRRGKTSGGRKASSLDASVELGASCSIGAI